MVFHIPQSSGTGASILNGLEWYPEHGERKALGSLKRSSQYILQRQLTGFPYLGSWLGRICIRHTKNIGRSKSLQLNDHYTTFPKISPHFLVTALDSMINIKHNRLKIIKKFQIKIKLIIMCQIMDLTYCIYFYLNKCINYAAVIVIHPWAPLLLIISHQARRGSLHRTYTLNTIPIYRSNSV